MTVQEEYWAKLLIPDLLSGKHKARGGTDMKQQAIITYHSAYNFGSVLQAYATQQTVMYMVGNAEIINYRMNEQKRYYEKLYRWDYGPKTILRDLLMLPAHNKRKKRAEAFEKFFSEKLILSKEVSEPEEVAELWGKYDTIISGSDQIWCKRSNELRNSQWKYIDPYILKGFSGCKISYASSIGASTDDDLRHILNDIQQFDAIAMREDASAKKMRDLLGHDVSTVLDPTFLLTKDEWIHKLNLKKNSDENYILYYSLGDIKNIRSSMKSLIALAKAKKKKILIVTPFAYVPLANKLLEQHPEYGPIDFITAIYNADMIVTDSYHGTILSVNFGKDFYSICGTGGAEFRKTDILNRLGLQERIITDVTVIPKLDSDPIDYTTVYSKLYTLRRHSLNYLKDALEGRKK